MTGDFRSMVRADIPMPKSCTECPFAHENEDLPRDDSRYLTCEFPYMGEFVTDYTASRHPECPLFELAYCGECREWDRKRKWCWIMHTCTRETFFCGCGKRKDDKAKRELKREADA